MFDAIFAEIYDPANHGTALPPLHFVGYVDCVKGGILRTRLSICVEYCGCKSACIQLLQRSSPYAQKPLLAGT
jgi:hypothetical protein